MRYKLSLVDDEGNEIKNLGYFFRESTLIEFLTKNAGRLIQGWIK